jgi:hypothetical protein
MRRLESPAQPLQPAAVSHRSLIPHRNGEEPIRFVSKWRRDVFTFRRMRLGLSGFRFSGLPGFARRYRTSLTALFARLSRSIITSRSAILATALILPCASHAALVLTGSMGANSRDHFRGAVFAYSAAGYLKFDDMTLIGVQSGQGSVAGADAIPLLGSAMVRLPIGRVVLPVATGDVGYAFADSGSGLLWRAGGGLDIRNGRHSSFLAQGAYESCGSRAGWLARLGLLLEF